MAETKVGHVAIIGRPNVGKSTLVNRLLGAERVVVYDQPGTTRDSIYIPFERNGKQFTLIDTAGGFLAITCLSRTMFALVTFWRKATTSWKSAPLASIWR